MKRLAALAAALAALAAHGLAQESCAVSKDLVVRALELASAHPRRDDLANGIIFLKQAEEACDENGDAWYYRAVFERQLGQGNPEYSMGKARERGSKALRDAENPFRLATPERGVAIAPRAGAADKKSARAGQDVRKPDVSQKWALVVGVANFRNPRLNLNYTDKDAESVAQLLRDPTYGHFQPDHVRLIENAAATTVNIRAGLEWLAHQASPDDLALIYIATHGTAREQDIAGANYILASDSNVDTEEGLYSTAIPMVEVTTVIRTRIRALKVVVILDTCHSGGALSKTVTIPSSVSAETVEHIKEGTGRVILAASQGEESSYEVAKYGHGIFTYYLLQALRQQKDASVDKIYQFVNAHVAQEAAANGWKQHPIYSASDDQSAVVIGIAPMNPVAWLWPRFAPEPTAPLDVSVAVAILRNRGMAHLFESASTSMGWPVTFAASSRKSADSPPFHPVPPGNSRPTS